MGRWVYLTVSVNISVMVTRDGDYAVPSARMYHVYQCIALPYFNSQKLKTQLQTEHRQQTTCSSKTISITN